MARDAGLVLATRNARMLQAAYDPENELPDTDAVGWGDDWGVPYADVGYTNGGITSTINVDRASIEVDQELLPVDRPITGGSVQFSTNLGQYSPENLHLASGIGEVETTAPGASDKGYTDFTITADFPEDNFSVAWEARKRDGEVVRGLIYRGVPTSSPAPVVGQADSNAQIAFEVEALPADNVEDHPLAVFRSIIPATGA